MITGIKSYSGGEGGGGAHISGLVVCAGKDRRRMDEGPQACCRAFCRKFVERSHPEEERMLGGVPRSEEGFCLRAIGGRSHVLDGIFVKVWD